MQSWCKSARVLVSTATLFVVSLRSPSAEAFPWPLFASAVFASAKSLLPKRISSVRDCLSNSKLCSALVSFFLASASCASALSRRLSSVEIMSPLWPSYTVAAGAPRLASPESSSDLWAACTNAVSFAPSFELRAEACTRTSNACATLVASFSCTMDVAPVCISFSRMPMARVSASMISVSSFSSVPNSLLSCARMPMAAFRSASSVAMPAESSSIFSLRDPVSAISLVMVAWSSAA
mmetsp:Transcript_68216/g.202987  ORF Transcript_68216/g.202987 Transcript_68216/m.202987 type:complete len:237 (+) Transcript_68216:844-1554(+)